MDVQPNEVRIRIGKLLQAQCREARGGAHHYPYWSRHDFG
jgi:hypothetical protein